MHAERDRQTEADIQRWTGRQRDRETETGTQTQTQAQAQRGRDKGSEGMIIRHAQRETARQAIASGQHGMDGGERRCWKQMRNGLRDG